MRIEDAMIDDYAKAEVKRPCVEVDLNGACLNQVAIDAMLSMLRDSMNEFEMVDILFKNVSRSVIPDLVVKLP